MMRDLVRRGLREHHDERRDLWESFLRVIDLARPPAVLMENVPDMALDRGMVILRTMVERLEQMGYAVEERVVDTRRYGVPQFRQRLILVALHDRVVFEWPEASHDRVTVDNAIGDLPEVEGGWRPSNGTESDPVASGWAHYAAPITWFQKRARERVSEADRTKVFDHITRPVREDDAIAFSQMDPGTRYSELASELQRYRSDIFDDKYKRLDPNDVSRTITAHIAKDGYWYIHPYQDRTLTVREAARLQTFRDDVRFAGPPSSAFKQIGNAVPPLLGENIGRAILQALNEPRPAQASTSSIATTLSNWLDANPPVRVPWLNADDRWVVIQAEILWNRIADELVSSAWASVRSLATPGDTLQAEPMLRRIARSFGRERRCDAVMETASWFAANPERLGSDATADDLVVAPNVSRSTADLACRIVPGDNEDPVIAQFGVLRVAARYHGEIVDRHNRLTDGRLAIARMIGGEDTSHGAHLALIELANGICGPEAPQCGLCPLVSDCAEARSRPVQPTLDLVGSTGSAVDLPGGQRREQGDRLPVPR
jgi:DNA (cytosine-5)-methyltransferase 1